MKKKKQHEPWKAYGPKPSDEAIVKALLVLLGRPPIIPPDVLQRIRAKEQARKERAAEAERSKPAE